MRRLLIHGAILAALALAAILFLMQYVPFTTPSYLFWAGVIVILAALVSLIRPLRFLLIRTRRIAALALLGGAACSACAMAWPCRLTQARSATLLGRLMPQYHFSEYHSIRVRAPREAALQTMRDVKLTEIRLVRALLGARILASGHMPKFDGKDRSITHFFRPLAEDPGREFVVGGPLTTPGGPVQMAFNLRAEDEGGGWTRLSTETRIFGTTEASARGFSRYWCAVYPGSAIIRQVWLEAAAAKLERSR